MKSPRATDRALESIGKRTRRQRGTRTQIEIAASANIDQSVLSRIETGKYPALTPELILRLCVALGCEPSDLLDGLDDVIVIARDDAARVVAS